MNDQNTSSSDTSPSFIPGHVPKDEDVQFHIGAYQVLKKIGKGGMGEVLLAYDTTCGRRVALKKIRSDLIEHTSLHNRFLKEARITSQLTHPAIMPIYTIQDENQMIYYTMPFVQGETLKQIFRTTREQEKQGKSLHHIGASIPALVRIFITVCQAIAYSHSKGVLHRDLKPENIMIGEYGEVLILDWGLAKLISAQEDDDEEIEGARLETFHELTRPGKVVGTFNFMAPERAKGSPATVKTEIYALGVILYQILTLRNPFQRGSLEEFRKNMDKETLLNPITVAPYRDVPRLLSRIAMKCLAKDPDDRYATVDELLREIENYIEGRSEWFQITELNPGKKKDWEFQENILITDHVAITRETESTDWVNLMISKDSFTENTKIEAEVKIGPTGSGIGFLMSIPEAAERIHLNDGYCLWLGSDLNKSTKLLRSTVEVIHAPEIYLERGRRYAIRIEKIDHNIHFFLDNALQFSYISHFPQVGTHIGILTRDGDWSLDKLSVFVGSQNITVNCLAVPDAFLAHKNYEAALNEYRRIGYSFPGRAEGREAMFRAGLCILEKARNTKDMAEKDVLYEEALVEFEKLHDTPGAPLEYLGKAHVYQDMRDSEEEIKCYELGFRKYPKHPLLPILNEQLVYRMHEISRSERKATYLFMLTALKHLPHPTVGSHTKKLFESLQRHWEPLAFFEEDTGKVSEELKDLNFRIKLAFWLANAPALVEMFQEVLHTQKSSPETLANILFCLLTLGESKLAKEKLNELRNTTGKSLEFELINYAIQCHEKTPQEIAKIFFEKKGALRSLDFGEQRLVLYLLEKAIDDKDWTLVETVVEKIKNAELPEDFMLSVDYLAIWGALLNKQWDKAGTLLQSYPLTFLTKETSPLFTLYGCFLAATETEEIAKVHFSGVLDVRFPRSWTLLSHFLSGKISPAGEWGKHAFHWEREQLKRQLDLYHHCVKGQQ